jgi:hypothetical protein
MTPEAFYELAVDGIKDYNEKRSYRGASIRQWRKRFDTYTVLMTEHRCVRKVTFKTRNARIVMIDRAYWITESGEREMYWQKEPPSDEEVMTALLMLS